MRAAKKLDAVGLWDYALKTAGIQARSTGELRTKLRARALHAEDVDVTIAKLREYGVLNDRRFAEGFANSRIENRAFGKARVLRDLRARRVAPEVAAKAVETAYEGRDEIALIEEYVRRKFRGKPIEGEKDLASAFRRLRGAGFTTGNSLLVLKRMVKDQTAIAALDEASFGAPDGEDDVSKRDAD
jgi:regulatory protein